MPDSKISYNLDDRENLSRPPSGGTGLSDILMAEIDSIRNTLNTVLADIEKRLAALEDLNTVLADIEKRLAALEGRTE